ncbi:MAG: N-formylglutamate amidohydrolase [Sphingobium sp.]
MDYPAPRAPAESTAGFDRYGPDIPTSPVVISVPHSGREYPPAMLVGARVGMDVLRRLEDRYADLLAHRLIARDLPVIIARAPRALIDLNRDEREVDPAMVTGAPRSAAFATSAKLRGGLGLVPRRLADIPSLWGAPLSWAELRDRIDSIHRPYHAAVARLMAAAREAHGHAILVDLHSMPPLVAGGAGQPAVRLVLGDRFGRGASARLMTLAADVAAGHGIATAQNHPYAGDHMIERHGRPAHGLHALQLEVDRSLYLDAALDRPGRGLARTRALIFDIVKALAVELPRMSMPIAAE